MRVYFSTGIYIKPIHWNKEKALVIKRPDSDKLNNRIIQTIEQYKDVEHKNRHKTDFSVYDLKQALENSSGNFIPFALAQLAKEKKLTPGTRIKYTKAIKTFKEFAGNDIPFAQLTNRLLDDFKFYLEKEGLINNTIKNYFKTLSKYALLAVRYNILEYHDNPFPAIKITKEKTTRHGLNDAELEKIEGLVFAPKNKHVEIVRDLFLLQCYTGLRFGDASRLSREHVHKTNEGMEIRMMSEKENKAVNLPISYLFRDNETAKKTTAASPSPPPTPETLPIQEHTATNNDAEAQPETAMPADTAANNDAGHKPSRPERLLLKYWREDKKPFFLSLKAQQGSGANNQYVNRLLKDIQGLAGVQTKLTNHVGRHTFATFLVWRVPLPVVQELLQHSKVETTMIYIHVGTDKVKEHLKKITDWI